MVVVVGETVTELPVPIRVPPQLPVYHFHKFPSLSEPVLMLSVVLFPLAIDVAVAESVGTVGLPSGCGFIFIIVALLLVAPSLNTTCGIPFRSITIDG